MRFVWISEQSLFVYTAFTDWFLGVPYRVKKALCRDRVRPSVCDPVSETKPFVEFARISDTSSLQSDVKQAHIAIQSAQCQSYFT